MAFKYGQTLKLTEEESRNITTVKNVRLSLRSDMSLIEYVVRSHYEGPLGYNDFDNLGFPGRWWFQNLILRHIYIKKFSRFFLPFRPIFAFSFELRGKSRLIWFVITFKVTLTGQSHCMLIFLTPWGHFTRSHCRDLKKYQSWSLPGLLKQIEFRYFLISKIIK